MSNWSWCKLQTLLVVSCSAARPVKSSSSNVPRMPSFLEMLQTLPFCSLLARCRIPSACEAKPHLNLQKWSEHDVVLLPFWLGNVLPATTACTFRHLTSKSAPRMVCFVHFDLECASQLPKVLRPCCVLHILTWKCASRHNGVQLFISHLARWLRTRRFSEPIFRPSGATHFRKNIVFRDFPTFPTFSCTCIFFLLTLSLLSSSLFCSSPLWFFPPLLFHRSIFLEVWLLNFLRLSHNQPFIHSVFPINMFDYRSITQTRVDAAAREGLGFRAEDAEVNMDLSETRLPQDQMADHSIPLENCSI